MEDMKGKKYPLSSKLNSSIFLLIDSGRIRVYVRIRPLSESEINKNSQEAVLKVAPDYLPSRMKPL